MVCYTVESSSKKILSYLTCSFTFVWCVESIQHTCTYFDWHSTLTVLNMTGTEGASYKLLQKYVKQLMSM